MSIVSRGIAEESYLRSSAASARVWAVLTFLMGFVGSLTGAVVAGLAWAGTVLLLAGSDHGPTIAVQGGLIAALLGAPSGGVAGAQGKPTLINVLSPMFFAGAIGLGFMLIASATFQEILVFEAILLGGIGLACVLGGLAGGAIRRCAANRGD